MYSDDSFSELSENLPGEQSMAALEEYWAICQSGSSAALHNWTAAHQDRLQELMPFMGLLQELWQADLDRSAGLPTSQLARAASQHQPLEPMPAPDSASQSWGAKVLTLGEFRLLAPIGQGAMGIIYLAEQPALCRKVAVKILQPAAMLDKTYQRRFEIESQAAARLHHPHIVQVFTVGCEAGIHYYAMQWIEGENLATQIERLRASAGPKQLPVQVTDTNWFKTVAKLGRDAADALDYAHQKGLVHRDIKPSNLLLDREGHVYVADFGLASSHEANNLTVTGQLVGTLRYASREQVLGDRGKIDHRTDVYSLGASLYEMATLRPPFDDSSRAALTHAVLTSQPSRPRSINRFIPSELEAVILKAIAPDLATRYATAAQLRDDLERFCSGQPVLARRPTLARQCVRVISKYPRSVATLLMALMLAVALLVVTNSYIAYARTTALESKKIAELKSRELGELQSITAGHLKVALEQELALQRMRYDNNLVAANLLIQKNDYNNAHQALERELPRDSQPDQRGIHWYLAKQICDTRNPRLTGHTAEVYQADWSPCGEFLATASQDKSIRIWRPKLSFDQTSFYGPNVSPGSLEFVLTGHTDEVNSVCFSNCGHWLASASDDKTIRIWDRTDNWQSIELAGHEEKVVGVAFSADAKYLFSSDHSGAMIVWDVERRQAMRKIQAHRGRIQAIAHNPKLNLLATCSDDGRVIIWNTSQLPDVTEYGGFADFQWGVFAVAWSPDGKSLAAGGLDARIHVWNADQLETTKFQTPTFHHVQSLQYSPDGKTLLATTNWPILEVFDAHSGERYATHPINSRRLWCGRYSPEGRYVALTGSLADVVLIDTHKTQRLADLVVPVDSKYESLEWSEDGRWLAGMTSDHKLDLRDGVTGQLVRRFPDDEPIEDVKFTSNNSLLTAGRSTRHWTLEPELKCTHSDPKPSDILCASGAPQYISCSNGLLWNKPEQRFEEYWWPETNARSTAVFFPQQTTVLIWTGFYCRWQQLPSGSQVHFEKQLKLRSAVFTPDSIIAIEDGMLQRFKINETQSSAVPFGPANTVVDIAMTRDQTTLVTVGGDSVLRFYSIATQLELLAIPFPDETLTAVQLSSDDRRMVLASSDSQGQSMMRFFTLGQ